MVKMNPVLLQALIGIILLAHGGQGNSIKIQKRSAQPLLIIPDRNVRRSFLEKRSSLGRSSNRNFYGTGGSGNGQGGGSFGNGGSGNGQGGGNGGTGSGQGGGFFGNGQGGNGGTGSGQGGGFFGNGQGGNGGTGSGQGGGIFGNGQGGANGGTGSGQGGGIFGNGQGGANGGTGSGQGGGSFGNGQGGNGGTGSGQGGGIFGNGQGGNGGTGSGQGGGSFGNGQGGGNGGTGSGQGGGFFGNGQGGNGGTGSGQGGGIFGNGQGGNGGTGSGQGGGFGRNFLRTKRNSSPGERDNIYNKWSFNSRHENINGKEESDFLGHFASNNNPEGQYYYRRNRNPLQKIEPSKLKNFNADEIASDASTTKDQGTRFGTNISRIKRNSSPGKKDHFYNTWSFDSRYKNINGNAESDFLGHIASNNNPEGQYYYVRNTNPYSNYQQSRSKGFIAGGGFGGGFRWTTGEGNSHPGNGPDIDVEVFDPITPRPIVPPVTPV